MRSILDSKNEETQVEKTSHNERKEKEAKIDEILSRWWNEHIHGSHIAATSEGWNHLVKVFPLLVKNLKSEI